MEQHILVISNKWDAHVDAVIQSIHKNAGKVIRINTEDFRQNKVSINIQNDSKKWYIKTPENRTISEDTIKGVYIRRLSMPIDVSDIDARFQNFAQKESLTILDSIDVLLENKLWLNRSHSRELASNKIRQLMVAQAIGLMIPTTLITNESAQAKQFCINNNALYKTLGCPILDFGDRGCSMINASIISKNTNFNSIEITPALLQHYVQKDYELRIHIIDTKIIAVKINSQQHPQAKIDWRIAQGDLQYEQIDIPGEIQQKLLQLMSKLQIQFGIIDMIVTKGGDYVFLEVNPDGNWLWIEQKIHAPISESIALYFLLDKGKKQ